MGEAERREKTKTRRKEKIDAKRAMIEKCDLR
jgi:hypothetical protein